VRQETSSSSSIGTATLVGFGLLSYRWVFSAGRFLQSAVASGTSNSQLGGPVIRTFQLLPPGVPHVWNDASEPQQRKVELWARNCREFCRKWRSQETYCSIYGLGVTTVAVHLWSYISQNGLERCSIFLPDIKLTVFWCRILLWFRLMGGSADKVDDVTA